MKDIHAIHHSRGLEAQTRAYLGGDVSNPTPRNLTTEMTQTLAGQQATAAPHFALEAQYQPQYAGLGLDVQRQGLYGFEDAQGAHHPGTLELGRTATQYQRAGDIADVAALGPAEREAYLNANPFLRQSLTQLNARTSDSPILAQLNAQAQAGLAGGGELSADEQRQLDQSTRQGWAARGMAMGPQALGSELLNRDSAKRGRLLAAQNFASGVQGLNQAQNDFVGRASQINATTLSDPWMAILGRSSGSGGGGGSGGSYPQTIGTGSQLFNPLNPYAQDLYNTNFNAQRATDIANANNSSAQNSALISAGGAVLGGLLSDIRAKEKIVEVGTAQLAQGSEISIVEFSYRDGCVPYGLRADKRYRGVLAQDVAEIMPAAVSRDPRTGFLRVNYPMLGLEMKEAA
jgi:hypothetical protein